MLELCYSCGKVAIAFCDGVSRTGGADCERNMCADHVVSGGRIWDSDNLNAEGAYCLCPDCAAVDKPEWFADWAEKHAR